MSIYKCQREVVKKRILEISIEIFIDKGYENTTIEEITKTVGIAKGTFYNFYPSKSAILMSWAGEKFQQINIYEAFNANKNLKENLLKFVEILVEAIEDEEQLFKSFLKEILKSHGDIKYNNQFDFIKLYRLIIVNSKDFDEVCRSLLDIKIDVLNNSLFMGLINWFDAVNTVEGLKEYLKSLVMVCLYGLLGDQKGERN